MRHLYIILFMLVFSASAQAQLIITEVMPNPAAVSDNVGEWFEVANNGPGPINLNGYVIRDNYTSFTIMTDVIIPDGGYFVFGIEADISINGGVNVDYMYEGIILGNSGDEIIIEDPFGTIIDSLFYSSGPSGASLYVDQNGDWQVEDTDTYGLGDFGTPGTGSINGPVSNVDTSFSQVKRIYR